MQVEEMEEVVAVSSCIYRSPVKVLKKKFRKTRQATLGNDAISQHMWSVRCVIPGTRPGDLLVVGQAKQGSGVVVHEKTGEFLPIPGCFRDTLSAALLHVKHENTSPNFEEVESRTSTDILIISALEGVTHRHQVGPLLLGNKAVTLKSFMSSPLVPSQESLLPWNCGRSLVTINQSLFILNKEGKVLQLDPSSIAYSSRDLLSGIGGRCYPLADLDPIEFIGKGRGSSLLCMAAYPKTDLWLVQTNKLYPLQPEGSYSYETLRYEIPIAKDQNYYLPSVFHLSTHRFLVVASELPNENGRDYLKNTVIAYSENGNKRTLLLPSELPSSRDIQEPPVSWENQINEMVTHGTILKAGGAVATSIILLVYQSGSVVFLGVTPSNDLHLLSAINLTRRKLNGCLPLDKERVILYGDFGYLIELRY